MSTLQDHTVNNRVAKLRSFALVDDTEFSGWLTDGQVQSKHAHKFTQHSVTSNLKASVEVMSSCGMC